jgi:hypothetical protein
MAGVPSSKDAPAHPIKAGCLFLLPPILSDELGCRFTAAKKIFRHSLQEDIFIFILPLTN